MGGPNNPFVVWGSCLLWLVSLITIIWALVLLFCTYISISKFVNFRSLIERGIPAKSHNLLKGLKRVSKAGLLGSYQIWLGIGREVRAVEVIVIALLKDPLSYIWVESPKYSLLLLSVQRDGPGTRTVNPWNAKKFVSLPDHSLSSIYKSKCIVFSVLGDILLITQTDLVIALLLLSGIIMLPTNCFMLYSIANGEKITHKSRVFCCPLWMLILWIIIVNSAGVMICIQKVYLCNMNTTNFIEMGMRHYRSVPRYKHFIDNIQWTLKCCGLNSYRDWFHHNWYDRLRDYEWDSHKNNGLREGGRGITVSDSVPLSCCKSGTCVPNYLLELGTHSIHTNGCGKAMYRAYMLSMNAHLIVFLLVIIIEVAVLSCVCGKTESVKTIRKNNVNVRHLMPINDKFDLSTSSSSCRLEESDDFEA